MNVIEKIFTMDQEKRDINTCLVASFSMLKNKGGYISKYTYIEVKKNGQNWIIVNHKMEKSVNTDNGLILVYLGDLSILINSFYCLNTMTSEKIVSKNFTEESGMYIDSKNETIYMSIEEAFERCVDPLSRCVIEKISEKL